MESKEETVLIPINLEYETDSQREYILEQLAEWRTSVSGADSKGLYGYGKPKISTDEIIPLTQWQSRLEENERMRDDMRYLVNIIKNQLPNIANWPAVKRIDNALNQ